MSVFDIKKNPAICVLPWVHEYKSIEGKTAPCCQGYNLHDDETIESLRQQMLKGTKPRACARCYKSEDESGYSPRIQETVDWIKKFGEPKKDNPKLQFVDLRYDATCNLKCKMCGPEYSTLWQKEKNQKFEKNIDTKKYLDSLNKRDLKKVYLAGGEPTYIKGYLVFLQELYDQNPQCEVIINTNLKKLSSQWREIFQKFKNLTIITSCDAVQTLGTYIRYPLAWQEFEDNVKFVKENTNFLQFNVVASNLTSHVLYETCSWMKKYSKNINLSILSTPRYMSEIAVPIKHRKTYIDNIEKLQKFPVSPYYAMNFRSKTQYLIKKYVESPYDKNLHENLTKEITEQDNKRSLKLEEVDTFLCSWVHG